MIITLADIEKALNTASKINETTRNMFKIYLKKLHSDIEFTTEEELEKIVNEVTSSKSQGYSMIGMLRCCCSILDIPNDIKTIIYKLYKQYNVLSKAEQEKNRCASAWTVDKLIEFNNAIEYDSYDNMITKLMIGLYTLIPPLRNDYWNVKINGTESNFINMETGELSVLSIKKQVIHSVIIPEELKDLIAKSIIYMPREYLFVTRKNKPFKTANIMYTQLLQIIKKKLGEKSFTINTFRHLYTMKSFTGSVADRLEACKGMLHSEITHLHYGV